MYLLFGLGAQPQLVELKRRPMLGFRKDMVAGLGLELLSLDDLGTGRWVVWPDAGLQTDHRAVEGS